MLNLVFNQSFKQLLNLLRLRNCPKNNFSCRVCNKKFSRKSSLYQHNKTKHDEYNLNNCKICLKVFATKYLLDVHSRVHTCQKPFVCSTCGRGFTRKSNLQTHKTTHSKERKHKCDICTEERFFGTKN